MESPGSVVQVGRVAFELSRFELVDDCCQVEGQWFGVRGRRFMRPALTVVVEGRSIRLLADLADKPWAAEDGEPWRATFPYTIEGDVGSHETELTVAPDVTVSLNAPGRLATAPRKKSASRRGVKSGQPGLRRTGGRSRKSADAALDHLDGPGRTSRTSAVEGERGERDALMREVSDLRDSQRRLEQQLDLMEADKATTAQRLDELSGELRGVIREREESIAARDRIGGELEAVQRERGEIAAERDDAFSIRDHALAERDVAAAERDDAVSAREALSRTTERLQSELAELLSARGAALVMRRAAQEPAVSRRFGRIFPAAIAVALAIVIILVVLLVVRVI
jgi:hypothetical protein